MAGQYTRNKHASTNRRLISLYVRGKRKMMKCELCDSLAKMYCESDQASLCWECDANVHGANFLVAKHSRTLLCHLCQSLTPWTGSGPKLAPTVSVCQNCVNSSNCRQERSNNDDDEDDSHDDLDREDDTENDGNDENSDGSDDGDEDDGENQVVPWSSPPPPPVSSSSNSEISLAGSLIATKELHNQASDFL